MKKLYELAAELNAALITDKRSNGDKIVKLDETKEQEWMTDVIYEAHGDDLPDDDIYAFIEEAAAALEEVEEDDPDDSAYDEAIYNMEPEIYTHVMTAWLARRVDHVYYITEVLEDRGPFKNGFDLLSAAHSQHREEVGLALLQALRNYLEGLEEEDEDEDDPEDEENSLIGYLLNYVEEENREEFTRLAKSRDVRDLKHLFQDVRMANQSDGRRLRIQEAMIRWRRDEDDAETTED